MPFRVQLAEEDNGYRIVGPDDEEGDWADYGVPASLEIAAGDHKGRYTALVGSPDQDEWESPEGIVFRGDQVETVVEEVEIQDEEEEEEGPEEESEA